MSATVPRPVDTGGIVVGLSATAVVVGAFLGWITVPTGETAGLIDGLALVDGASPLFNGLVTTTIAAIVTALALVLPDLEVVNAGTAVSGLGIEVIAVTVLVAPDVAIGSALAGDVEATLASTGIGIYLTILGGVGILLGAVLSYRR